MAKFKTLDAHHDPMGSAIFDFFKTGKAVKLRVLSSMFDEDEIPVSHLFRSFAEMPDIEQQALRLSKGNVLDVGAGSGCHSMAVQQLADKGELKVSNVKAVDVSPLSCEVMQQRGVQEVQCVDFFDERLTGTFDTILLLMNGTGIVGKLERLPLFFARLRQLLTPGGVVLIDSSDLKYLYEDEDGNLDLPEDFYYGEVDYRMQYKNAKGQSFNWLYLDFDTLASFAKNNGFNCRKVTEDNHYAYLAELTSTD